MKKKSNSHLKGVLAVLLRKRLAFEKTKDTKKLWATTKELCQVTHRFSARIYDLRSNGLDICTLKVEKKGKSYWKYCLSDDYSDVDPNSCCLREN